MALVQLQASVDALLSRVSSADGVIQAAVRLDADCDEDLAVSIDGNQSATVSSLDKRMVRCKALDVLIARATEDVDSSSWKEAVALETSLVSLLEPFFRFDVITEHPEMNQKAKELANAWSAILYPESGDDILSKITPDYTEWPDAPEIKWHDQPTSILMRHVKPGSTEQVPEHRITPSPMQINPALDAEAEAKITTIENLKKALYKPKWPPLKSYDAMNEVKADATCSTKDVYGWNKGFATAMSDAHFRDDE